MKEERGEEYSDGRKNRAGKLNYIAANKYKILTFLLAGLVIANALGVTGWVVETTTGLEVNIPKLAFAAGNSCKPDGGCGADKNKSDCLDDDCCEWVDKTGKGKGGGPFCACKCFGDYCVDGKCVECEKRNCFNSFISWTGSEYDCEKYWSGPHSCTPYGVEADNCWTWNSYCFRRYRYDSTKYLYCSELTPPFRNKKEVIMTAEGIWWYEKSVYQDGWWGSNLIEDITPPNKGRKPSGTPHCVDIF